MKEEEVTKYFIGFEMKNYHFSNCNHYTKMRLMKQTENHIYQYLL